MEQEQPIGLSLEQEFNQKAFEEKIKRISLEQAKLLLSDLHRNLLLREVYIKNFIQQSLLSDFSAE